MLLFLTLFFAVCSSSGVSYQSLLYTTQSFTSPNYPSNYPPSANCFWMLKRPSASYGVRLSFNSFHLEARIANMCRGDYVEIWDGDTFSSSTYVGNICGSGIPPIIVSRYTYLFVRFISDFDDYPSRRYFSASFKAILKGKFTTVHNFLNKCYLCVDKESLNEYQAIISAVTALFQHLQMTASRFDIAHEKTTGQQKLILKKG